MAMTVVQFTGAFGSSVSSITIPGIITTPGNLLHVDSCCFRNQANNMSVADSNLNSWSNAVAKHDAVNAFSYAQSDYAQVVSGGSGHTVTLSLGGSGFPAMSVFEISGQDSVTPLRLAESGDNAANQQPSMTTSGSAVTGDVAIAAIGNINGANTILSEPANWTIGYDDFSLGAESIHTASSVLLADGPVTYNPTTQFNQPWFNQITVYKPVFVEPTYLFAQSIF